MVLIAIAGGLCGFEQFEGPIPINKNLWTLSFVCLMGGWGFLVLGALYAIIDHFKLWDGQPFRTGYFTLILRRNVYGPYNKHNMTHIWHLL